MPTLKAGRTSTVGKYWPRPPCPQCGVRHRIAKPAVNCKYEAIRLVQENPPSAILNLTMERMTDYLWIEFGVRWPQDDDTSGQEYPPNYGAGGQGASVTQAWDAHQQTHKL